MIPKVSVITATYFRPDLLRRCILSVQNNTFKDYEHIIISDHCPYAKDIYNEFKDDLRIKFLEVDTEFEKSQGAIAKNIGINNSKSEYICYCDDDNIFLPNHIESLYKSIKESESHAVYSCGWHVFVLDEFEMMERDIVEKNNVPNIPDSFLKSSINNCGFKLIVNDKYWIINHDMLNIIHTKALIKDAGMWKTANPFNPVEDNYLMSLFTSGNYKIEYIRDITCVYYARTDRGNKYKNWLLEKNK